MREKHLTVDAATSNKRRKIAGSVQQLMKEQCEGRGCGGRGWLFIKGVGPRLGVGGLPLRQAAKASSSFKVYAVFPSH